jgi:DNA repair exonuclease SbcCD ATPase subunit
MAEIEYGGIKLGGSKLLLVLPLLATLGGGAWATFEFYKDYTDMKEIIANIDTQKIEAQQKQINQQLTDAIDIKNGLREDIVRLERIVDKVEDDMNKLEDKTRTYVDDAEERFDTKRDNLLNQYVAQKDLLIQRVEQLKKYMDNKLQRALDNPLAK